MHGEVRSEWLASLPLFVVLPVASARPLQDQSPEGKLHAAVAQYNSGKYSADAAVLESLVRQVPDSFEAHELLGRVYAAEGDG